MRRDLNARKLWVHESSPVNTSRLSSACVADGVGQGWEIRRRGFDKQVGAGQDLTETQIETIVVLSRVVKRSMPFGFRLVRTRHRSHQSRGRRQCSGIGRRLQFSLDNVETAEIYRHHHQPERDHCE